VSRSASAAHATYKRAVAAVRAALNAETFAVTWAAGQALPMEEAITIAVEDWPTNSSAL